MADKCEKGTVWSLELKKCVPGEKLKPPGREGQYKYKSDKQRARERIVGPVLSKDQLRERLRTPLSEKLKRAFPKGKLKGKKMKKGEAKKYLRAGKK